MLSKARRRFRTRQQPEIRPVGSESAFVRTDLRVGLAISEISTVAMRKRKIRALYSIRTRPLKPNRRMKVETYLAPNGMEEFSDVEIMQSELLALIEELCGRETETHRGRV